MKIGLQALAGARAEAQVQEQISSLQQLFKQHKEENIQLQQRLDEMEGLRKLEVEQGNPTSLLVENSISGLEIKADHEGEGSAAPVPNPENGRMGRFYCCLVL